MMNQPTLLATLDMMESPTTRLSWELTNKMDTINSFEKAEQWVREVVQYRQATRTSPATKALAPLESAMNMPDEQVEVDGELCWLKRQDGKISLVKTGRRAPTGARPIGNCWK